ncbi:MAG: hypothetical protein HW416_2267 [Chloroflexi bacterium]|nr:hypothetical protein [Chloroflexota bacterium]
MGVEGVAARMQRGALIQELTRTNPWWTNAGWQASDPHLATASRAPYDLQPTALDAIAPPNLYTLRGPRRVGKTTLLKQTIAVLCQAGVDPRRICYFAADALSSYVDA